MKHGCISSKLMLSDLMLSDLRNVNPMMNLSYKQPVGPMKAHGAVRQWANVVLQTLAQRKWQCGSNDGPTVVVGKTTLAQHVGSTKAHSAVRRWPKVVLPTLSQQSWQQCPNVGPTATCYLGRHSLHGFPYCITSYDD